MKIKTSDLNDVALDWVVTKLEAERKRFLIYPEYVGHYSTDWAKAGPIIQRESIAIRPHAEEKGVWSANVFTAGQTFFEEGATALIAALRCYVASRLGDEVDVPENI